MAQHDYVIANGTGAAVRSDLNNALAAIVSQNSGATEPATTYAFQFWADTTTGLLKLRNSSNNAWVTLFQLDGEWSTLPVENGTAAAPSIYFKDSGTDTGFYSPGTDQVAISTGGTGRLFINSSGSVGIGTSSPHVSLQVHDGNIGLSSSSANAAARNWRFGANDAAFGDFVIQQSTTQGGTSYATKFYLSAAGNVGIGSTSIDSSAKLAVSNGGAEGLEFQPGVASGVCGITSYNRSGSAYTSIRSDAADHRYLISGTEKARLDSSGRWLLGTSSARANMFNSTLSSAFQVEGTTHDTSSVSIVRNSNDSSTAAFVLGKSRSTTAGGSTLVANNDTIAYLTFQGADGSQLVECASIAAYIDGTPGADDMPGRLVFSTTADGASSPTERMRIHNGGAITMAGGLNVGDSSMANGGSKFILGGSILSSGAGTYPLKWNNSNGNVTYDTSSRLIKEEIVDCPYGIEALKQLQPRKYFRTDDQREEIGFIADEVVGLMPEFVPVGPKSVITRNEDDTEEIPLGVNYDKLTAVLTKALQEALEKIETLEAKVAALESA